MILIIISDNRSRLGLFWKKQNVKQVAEIVIGFGVLFVGLKSMSSAMAGVRDMPEVVEILASLTNPFLATLAGFVLTAIIQRSSVTVSIVLLMATQNLFKQ